MENNRLIKALLRQPVDKTPVWLMRQAGRYLPEYRELRAKAGSFMNLCKNPEWACEVTLQPLRRFPLDAAILFSDILTIPDAMGLGLYFTPGQGPAFERPLQNKADIEKLGIPDPEIELAYVHDAIRLIRKELNGKTPLIGFCGSPWTNATYMVEGNANKTFGRILSMTKQDPQILHLLLDKVADAVILHLNAQIKAGAQAIMLFDTWGGLLNTEDYLAFSLRYAEKIAKETLSSYEGQTIPKILFTKKGSQWLEQMATTGYDALGLDWEINIGEARERVGHQVALQGNLNPETLFETPEVIKTEVKKILSDFGNHSGHVFNLGHGINKETPIASVEALVEAVHEFVR